MSLLPIPFLSHEHTHIFRFFFTGIHLASHLLDSFCLDFYSHLFSFPASFVRSRVIHIRYIRLCQESNSGSKAKLCRQNILTYMLFRKFFSFNKYSIFFCRIEGCVWSCGLGTLKCAFTVWSLSQGANGTCWRDLQRESTTLEEGKKMLPLEIFCVEMTFLWVKQF